MVSDSVHPCTAKVRKRAGTPTLGRSRICLEGAGFRAASEEDVMAYGTWPRSFTDHGAGSWDLPPDATLRVQPGRNGVILRADAGLLHVTQSGDPEDHVLAPGAELRLPRGGLVVAFALAESRVVVRAAPGARQLSDPRRAALGAC
jgi:hypothetical protein